MISQDKFITSIQDLAKKNLIISISGESGLGKTSLALYLIGNLMPIEKTSCAWVQASESFPKNRMISMFKNSKDKLDYINDNIFIIPRATCRCFSELKSILKSFSLKNNMIPPHTKYMVIDNISHHLRFHLQQITNNNNQIILCLNDFFSSILYPLLTFCFRNNVIPILIHEMSFNPHLNQNKIFFYKLFERIESLFIFLSKDRINNSKHMTIAYQNQSWKLKYILSNNGFEFYI